MNKVLIDTHIYSLLVAPFAGWNLINQNQDEDTQFTDIFM